MTKSVDKNAKQGESLDEESNVIELTDEVGQEPGASSPTHPAAPRPDAPQDGDGESMDDEFDALTREMPEFRMPEETESSGELPGAAIISGRRQSSATRNAADTSTPTVKDSREQAEADAEADDPNMGAKTVQMAAVSRQDIERHYHRERLKEAVLLEDHRFAPDVLICPPRLLTTDWQDGGPLKRATLAEARRDTVDEELDGELKPQTAPPPAADFEENPFENKGFENEESGFDETQTVKEITSIDALDEFDEFNEDDLPELDPDSVEIDLDEIDAPEAKPPPQPAKPTGRQSPPPKLPAGASSEAPAEAATELGGLVQEILEETSGVGETVETGAQAVENRQKRARNRPRSPRDTWFQKVFTDEYFRTLPSDIHRQTRRESDFIEASLDLEEGDRVLDLACGFGRHSIELTRRGHEVVGIDLSMSMLQKALNEAQRQDLSIKFIHGDMRDLKFDGIFSDCLLWQTSFGFFDDQTNFRVLRGIHRALRPGGELLIDVLNRDHVAPRMPHRLWWEGVNCVFLEEVDLNHRTSVLHTKRSFIYEDGTPPLEQSFYIRLYSPHELRHLLHAAGFSVVELSGELHHRGQFLGPASTRVVMRAKKRSPQKKNGGPKK